YPYGLGIYNAGTVTMTRCSVLNHTSLATRGTGIYNAGTLTLDSSTIAGNASGAGGAEGGGIFNLGMLTLRNGCVVKDNYGYEAGGIESVRLIGSPAGSCFLSETTFRNN